MDPRSWPWRMKTSLKALTEKKSVDAFESAFPSDGSARQEANMRKGNNVKKSRESYALIVTSLEHHVITLKDEIKIWREEVQDLTQKLCEAQLEMTAKDSLVNQHSKVAEEAVSGWEKAKAKYMALKSQLETVTLAKITTENRASHLDSALKECMMQVTLVKEEHEKLFQEVILMKSKEWDMVKMDLEGQIVDLVDRLLKSTAENAVLSNSLKECSDVLLTINELSHVELENQELREKIEDYEKEMKRVKYEMSVLTKEVEIRNEEKVMSIKSAEATNKKHLEGVKKVMKLEAECQRLRGLVRKKLPGPTALAQIKQETTNLGQERRPHARKPPSVKSKILQTSSGIPSRKESELLKSRLLMAEEKTKMLKEALNAQNIVQKPRKSTEMSTEGSLVSVDGSVASISDDGIDEDGSSVGSWIESASNSSHLSCNIMPLELMDDFLEMERRLTYSSLDHDIKQKKEVAAAEAELGHVQDQLQIRSFHYSASAQTLERIQQGSSALFFPPK